MDDGEDDLDRELAIPPSTSLLSSSTFLDFLSAISQFKHDAPRSSSSSASTSSSADAESLDPLYPLVVRCSRYLPLASDEFSSTFNKLVATYETRFPGLQTLVRDPNDYVKVVKLLGNGDVTQETGADDDADGSSSSSAMSISSSATAPTFGQAPRRTAPSASSSSSSAVGGGGVPVPPLSHSLDSICTAVTHHSLSLSLFLPSTTVLTLTVSSSMSPGIRLSPSVTSSVLPSLLSSLTQLQQVRQTMLSFVSKSMPTIAPNVTALVGPTVGSTLLALATGIDGLSRVPACNLPSFGASRRANGSSGGSDKGGYVIQTGVDSSSVSSGGGSSSVASSLVGVSRLGVLADVDLVRSARTDDKRKVVKILSCKVVLAARCDAERNKRRAATGWNCGTGNGLGNGVDEEEEEAGKNGRLFREELVSKIAKWTGFDKARCAKSLPKPDMSTKKRRGGKKVRKAKERFGQTEMHALANKVAFGTKSGSASDYGDDAMGRDMGMLGAGMGGRAGGGVREVKSGQKAALSMSKMAVKRRGGTMGAGGGGGGGGADGFASSVVFTPTTGMEFVDPNASKRRMVEMANKKWFGDSGFASAKTK